MADYTCDLPVSEEQLAAIGMVAVEWSYLESVLDAAIWNTAQFWDRAIGEAITAHLSVRARVDMLATLLNLHVSAYASYSPDDQENFRRKFAALSKRVFDLNGNRNALVHSRWVRGD